MSEASKYFWCCDAYLEIIESTPVIKLDLVVVTVRPFVDASTW